MPEMFIFVFLLLSSLHTNVAISCNQLDRTALLSFHLNLNSSSTDDCCRWDGVLCDPHLRRVTHISLPGRALSGTLPSFLNLTFLAHLNLSRNHLSGPLPFPLPPSLRTVDLSGNRFTGEIEPSFLRQASNLLSFNVSNNSFTGSIPSSVCRTSPLLQILDISANQFSGPVPLGFGGCSNLKVFRAGFNSLSGGLPYDLFSVKTLNEISLPNNRLSGMINNSIVLLPNLTILELQVNELSGEIPSDIGLLSNLEQLQLHTNSLNGSLPHSLTDCSRLTTLLLRNNHLGGEISSFDFSKLGRLQSIDLGNNTFSGNIPSSLCLCRSLTALRLAYNQFVGELPPCMASLKSLAHLSLSDNYLSNVVGALKILKNCPNLSVLFMSRCYQDEMMPDDDDLLYLNGFQELQILTLGGCKLKGEIPTWIAKLRKLKVLNLSYNKISGQIPIWLGSMPSLFVLNLTMNFLSGELPQEIGRLPALITDNSSSDLSYLALPFLFDSLQYNRLFNLPRGVKVGYNNLSGNIPAVLGQLKLLHVLDLNDNNFNGSIPAELSQLVNLERLDVSRNHLSGMIPGALTGMHFLSWFSVANNDLEGEVPTGGQFDTFPAASFEGNPNLCGRVIRRSCSLADNTNTPAVEEESGTYWSWRTLPFGLGYFLGFFAVTITSFFQCWRSRSST